jgi:hypothetical protein
MQRKQIFWITLITLLTSLACTIFVGGPDYPEQTIPITAEEAEALREQIRIALEAGATSGVLSLQITEAQLTSLLAEKLAEQGNPLFNEPQVHLREGQMKVYGKGQRGIFLYNISLTMAVSVDELGQPKVELVEANFGPVPVPEGINDAISALVAEAYTGSLGPVLTGFRLESIVIADGLMTVSGQIK